MIEPVFSFKGDTWVKIKALHSNIEVNQYINKYYLINKKCEVLSLHKLSLIQRNDHTICFHIKLKNNTKIYYRPRKTRLCLHSWKPYLLPGNFKLCRQHGEGVEYHADHIETNGPNHLNNLQWLSATEHAKKTRCETKNTRQPKSKSSLIYVEYISCPTFDKKLLDKTFASIKEASQKLNIPYRRLCASLKRNELCNGIKLTKETQKKYHNEIWKPFANGFISNKGRWKTARGNISLGYVNQYKRSKSFCRYRRISTVVGRKRKQVNVHKAVWEAFKGPVPPGMLILHDDTKCTRDSEGYERNWLEDLSVGTQSENISSYHRNTKVF